MGTWGEGVFDNDSAADLQADMEDLPDDQIEAELVNELQSGMDDMCVEDTEMLLAAVAILQDLFKRTGRKPPATLDRPGLRDKMLQVYDEEIDGLEPKDNYKTAWRKVMQETLDRFVALK